MQEEKSDGLLGWEGSVEREGGEGSSIGHGFDQSCYDTYSAYITVLPTPVTKVYI